MHPRCTNLLAALAAAAYLLASGAAQADAEKCKSAILKASSGFVQAKVKALQKCRERVVKGQLPPDTDCESNRETGQAITKARAKLESRIVSACSGGDETCGTADDDDLASIGWDIGTCPNFGLEGCSNPIGSCADIVTCLECVDDAAVDAAIALDYDGFKLTDPVAERDLNRCQLAIGKESVKFLVVQSKILARCWQAVNKGKATAPCPDPGDGKAQAAIERAAAKRTLAICKACGGDDEACGTPDDLTPEEIGFNSYCTIFVSCADTIESLQDIVQCLDCDTRLEGGCIDQNAVPAFTPPRPLCDSILFQVPETALDYTLPASEGEVNLATGFTPDPLSVAMTAGGGIDVNYLGSSCFGFANAAPDFQVNFGGGGSLLRFYFVGTGDSTIVLNDPFGNFYCVDDSFGTFNPTIDFSNPSGGAYDVWVGSFALGAEVSGTLFVTQSDGNHP